MLTTFVVLQMDKYHKMIRGIRTIKQIEELRAERLAQKKSQELEEISSKDEDLEETVKDVVVAVAESSEQAQ